MNNFRMFFEKKYLEDCRIPEVDFNDILDYASFRYDLSKEDKKFIEKYLLSPDRNLIKNSADRHQNTLIFLVRRFLREYKKYMLDCDLRRKDQCYGRIDGIGPAYDSESGNQGLFFARFWKDAITTGLSFPTEPAKEERESLQKQMILNLWQAYHRPLIVYSNCLPNIDETARKHETDTWFGIDSLDKAFNGTFTAVCNRKSYHFTLREESRNGLFCYFANFQTGYRTLKRVRDDNTFFHWSYLLTTLIGEPAIYALAFSTAQSIMRWRLSLGAHEMCGVIMQFLALSKGLSSLIGSV